MAPRETENNAYAKFWGNKQRTLWYVMVFLEWSILSHGSTFVYMIPPQNVMPARVTPARVHPGCSTGARISLRCEISQRYM